MISRRDFHGKNGQTAPDTFVERLLQPGMATICGLPGDGVNGMIDAQRKRPQRVKFIPVRHEEARAPRGRLRKIYR